MVQRYDYWYSNHVYVGRSSGMRAAIHGEYVKHRDVAQDIADAQMFRQLVARAQAIGKSLQQLVLEAEHSHEASKVNRPRVIRMPEQVKSLLRFTNGKSQRIYVHSIPPRQITQSQVNEPIVVNWVVGVGVQAVSEVDYLGPLPDDIASLWLEFDENYTLFATGYWQKANTTVVWA